MFEYCYPEATDPGWERVTESVACCPEATDPGWERVTKSVACHPEATDSGWERVTKSVACYPEATDPGWERVKSVACHPEATDPGWENSYGIQFQYRVCRVPRRACLLRCFAGLGMRTATEFSSNTVSAAWFLAGLACRVVLRRAWDENS